MKIAVVGGYGVGMAMRVLRAPAAGESVTGGVLSIGHGGKGSNQAIAAARLGAEVTLYTAVGQDRAAEDAWELWRSESVAATALIGSQPTMAGFIVVDAKGENRIAIAPGALDELTPESIEGYRAQLGAADLAIVSLEIPVAAAVAALRIAREEGTMTLLNPAPAAALPQAVWSTVDILTPNRSEAAALLGRGDQDDDLESLAAGLQSRFGCTVVLTAGTDGVFVDDGVRKFAVAASPVDGIVDTTGAGDAFTAALGVALAGGSELADAVRFAAAAGAEAVTVRDVVPSLPTLAQVENRLKSTLGTTKEPSYCV
jgi:ribokinase